jgi:hypothetical protein
MAYADTLPFDLKITGDNFNFSRQCEISDVGEGKTTQTIAFKSLDGAEFSIDWNYKKLPRNRSYPTNIDLNVKDASGKKIGYLFWALNDISFLRKMGEIGMVIDIDGKPVDFKLAFDSKTAGSISESAFLHEPLIQDTIVAKSNFQMIRPVILGRFSNGEAKKEFPLDAMPYKTNFTVNVKANGVARFEQNLISTASGSERLLDQVYFTADSIETLRGAMYATNYFDDKEGTMRMVFYPANGQTEPNR